MNAIHNARRAAIEINSKRHALPPGFRKIFENQKMEGATSKLASGESALNSPIQDTDPASVTFGQFFFMVGYD